MTEAIDNTKNSLEEMVNTVDLGLHKNTKSSIQDAGSEAVKSLLELGGNPGEEMVHTIAAQFGQPPTVPNVSRDPVLPDVTKDSLAALAKKRGRAGTILTGPNKENPLGTPGGEGGKLQRKTLLGL